QIASNTILSGATFYQNGPINFANALNVANAASLGATGQAVTISSNLVVGAAGTLITMTPLSASQFVKTDANKNLISQNKIDLSADVTGALPVTSLSGSNLPGGSTSYIQATSALQSGATFYVSSGTVNALTVGSSIGLPSGSVAVGSLVAGSNGSVLTVSGGVPVWQAGSGNYILNQNTLQAGSTFYVSSGTIQNNLNVLGTITG